MWTKTGFSFVLYLSVAYLCNGNKTLSGSEECWRIQFLLLNDMTELQKSWSVWVLYHWCAPIVFHNFSSVLNPQNHLHLQKHCLTYTTLSVLQCDQGTNIVEYYCRIVNSGFSLWSWDSDSVCGIPSSRNRYDVYVKERKNNQTAELFSGSYEINAISSDPAFKCCWTDSRFSAAFIPGKNERYVFNQWMSRTLAQIQQDPGSFLLGLSWKPLKFMWDSCGL